MCPDNFLYLTYLAARTSRIRIRIGACILPWYYPLRVLEKLNLLDIMSDGCLDVAFGRGLSRHEDAGFGIEPAKVLRDGLPSRRRRQGSWKATGRIARSP